MIDQEYRIWVDETDIYDEFGIFLMERGHIPLVQWPTTKAHDSNDWAEIDGVEVDLTDYVIAARTLSLPFFCERTRKLEAFLALLSDGATHQWHFQYLDMTYSLRVTGVQTLTSLHQAALFNLTFAEDKPTVTKKKVGNTLLLPAQGCRIDGVDLAYYGIYVLEGTVSSFRRWASVRENLKKDYKGIDGVAYDSVPMTFKSKDSVLSLLIHTKRRYEDFLTRYYSLLTTFLNPGSHDLYLMRINRSYACFYKSCSVKEFVRRGEEVWCEFDVTVTLTEWPTAGVGVLVGEESTVKERAYLTLDTNQRIINE